MAGWPAAWTHLDRIESDAQREELGTLVRELGVQGPAALEYAARQAMFLTGLSKDPPTPKAALKPAELRHVERRVRDEVARLDRKRYPRMLKSLKPVNNVVPIQAARRG